mmetsp:Transcript_13655/g.29597  ORF Transcript_13655/g.29597 Transcript_13655/m.29597 type:complete len:216 (-) Transcript_13655:62-709(-)
MSKRNEASERAPGELTPNQFASYIERGLNIHVHDEKLFADAKAASELSPDDETAATKLKSEPENDATIRSAGGADAGGATGSPTFPRTECTNGAMEALRLCHSAFLSALSVSLGGASASSSAKRRTLTEEDVAACAKRMGLSDLARRAADSLSAGDDDADGPRPKRRKKKLRGKDHFFDFKGTREELIAEQERLLAESARRVQTMNATMQGKREE